MSDSKSMNLGGDSKSFPFDNPGDTVTGRITDFEEMTQTDMQTGQPATWDDGRPKMMLRVDLATNLRADEHDDGIRSVFLRGSRKPESCSSLAAVAGAIKAATGGTAIQVGATLTLTYTGDGEVTKRGFNAPKKYAAKYAPKSATVDSPAIINTPATMPGVATTVAAEPNTLTPEQIAALVAQANPAPAAVDPIAAHPQGAALRAAGVPDDVIKASLGIAA